jgi:hypothetical protein
MQAVTVSISSTGISYLLDTLLGSRIAQALQDNLTTPGHSFGAPNFVYWIYNNLYEIDYSGINVTLGNGTFKSFAPVFQSYVQGPDDNSQFAITMVASNVEVLYNWYETYTSTRVDYTRAGKVPEQSQPGSGNYPYTINISKITITATFKLAASAGGYTLTYVGSSADPGNAQPNIPSASILSLPQSTNCGFSTQVAQLTEQQLANIDYGSCVAAALKPVFASISDSGTLGDVQFNFLAPGESGLVFPSGGGIQIGAQGGVTVNNVAYPALAPAGLPLPPIPTGSPPPDMAYYIQDYEMDALFWGFNAAGLLATTLTSGDLADPQALQTDTYQGGSFNNLYMRYPGQLMAAGLSALAAPTVLFQTVYLFTAQNLQAIQTALGPTVWNQYGNEINELSSSSFSSQAGLEAELALIDPNLSAYATVIEQQTGIPGVVVTHTTRCVLNVLHLGTAIPVITFDVAQTFLMEQLQLGQSSTGTAQSVIFSFSQPMDNLPVATFVSSTIPGINGGDFADVWNALRPNWQDVLNQVGKAGLPLPRIPGFEFLFNQATVNVVVPQVSGGDGYVSVLTNVTYSPQMLTSAVQFALTRPAVLEKI